MTAPGGTRPRLEIRPAEPGDAGAVAELAAELAQSFPFSAEAFADSYPALLADDGACLLLAVSGPQTLGYVLGFFHLTFFAGGPVGWVEEIVARPQARGQGVGAALMSAFEERADARGCALVALATRRAAPFYLAIGYEESAVYFRKVRLRLRGRDGRRRRGRDVLVVNEVRQQVGGERRPDQQDG